MRGNKYRKFTQTQSNRYFGNEINLVFQALSHSFVCCLNQAKFGIWILKWFNSSIWWFFGSMQHKCKLLDSSLMVSGSLEASDQSPFAARIFSPGMSSHERPEDSTIKDLKLVPTS